MLMRMLMLMRTGRRPRGEPPAEAGRGGCRPQAEGNPPAEAGGGGRRPRRPPAKAAGLAFC